MKSVSESLGLRRLAAVRKRLRREIRDGFEYKAKDCLTCDSPGACCLDAHFVNVRITRLEAKGIRMVIDGLPEEIRDRVYSRVKRTIGMFGLDSDPANVDKKFACPLYEKGTGCLVHETAKPMPCIMHACYENKEDLPPEEMLVEAERMASTLNARCYGQRAWLLPLPLAIAKAEPG